MPTLDRVIETCLYVDDLARAAVFYEGVLGLAAMTGDARFRAYDVGGKSVLLLFRRGATLETVHLPGGTIPPHDGHGPLHVAFAVSAEEFADWEARLAAHQVAVEGRTDWPQGGAEPLRQGPGRASGRACDAGPVEDLLAGVWKGCARTTI